jgi:hypothetical protein
LAVLLAQTAAAWAMAGFIWTMQVLNYPLLALIDRESFPRYETAHNRRFAIVLGPGLLIAVATTVALYFLRSPIVSWWAPITQTVLLLVVIATTARYGAPAHTRLAQGFEPAVHVRLVRSNWVRVAAWTALAILDLVLLYRSAKG